MTVLKVNQITAGYDQPVLQELSLSVPAGKTVSVVGRNGSGKSTLLKCIIGLLRPSSGSILLNQEEIIGRSTHNLIELGLAYVPQTQKVFSTMTVDENLELGGILLRNAKQASNRKEQIYDEFPILKQIRRQLAGGLSGGQQQVLGIARALLTDPKVLLLDEPSIGMDPVVQGAFWDELIALKDAGRSILMIEQNLDLASRADLCYRILEGKAVDIDPCALRRG